MSGRSDDRRAHKRQDIDCPFTLFSRAGKMLAKGKTINLSDGGALIPLSQDRAGDPGDAVNVTLSVPRSTPNTYMLENFAATARVARRQGLADSNAAGVAIQFSKPLHLALEV